MKKGISQLINKGSTLFLKLVLLFLALAACGLLGLFIYISVTSETIGMFRPILLGICVTIVPFLYALYQAYKLLEYIDKNEAFSEASLTALKRIKASFFIISLLFAGGMPYIYYVAEIDDAPGMIIMGMVLAAAPFVLAVFAAVLLQLIQNAMTIKSENDLTV